MNKTIEELAKKFTDELFPGCDLIDFDTQDKKNDAYVMCMAFGNRLMGQPLSVRLTADEKEMVRKMYADTYPNDIGNSIASIMIMQTLERIFGAEFFKENKR